MSKSFTKFLKIAIPLGLGIFLIWYSYSRFTPEQLDEIKLYFTDASYSIVLLAVFVNLLSHILRAYRWNFMLEPMGYKPSIWNNFMAISIAYLVNIFIPKGGEISRAVVLDKYEDVPFEKGFGTIISERIIDLVFLMIFTAIALILQFDELYNYFVETIPFKKMLIAGIAMFVLFILFLLFLKYSRSALRNKLRNFFLGLKEGVFSVLRMRKKTAFLIQTIIIWCLYLVSFYIATFALPETSGIDLGTVVITFVVGSFSFAFTNSGFGSYPFFVAGILAVFGIASTVGTAFGWIVWTSNMASVMFFGGLSFFLLPVFNRSRS